jgi:hypothetical protein
MNNLQPRVKKAVVPAVTPKSARVAPPGLEEIVVTFGDIYDYVRPGGSLDPRWQAHDLASMELPFPCCFPGILRRG